jgi:sugar phosphate isomerase/epimerase
MRNDSESSKSVDIPTIIEELKRAGFDGPTTLEVAGEDNVKACLSSLHQWTGRCKKIRNRREATSRPKPRGTIQ